MQACSLTARGRDEPAAASAAQLEAMKREIAELEAQMAQTMPADKPKRGGSAGYGIVLVDVAALSPNMQLMVCSGSVLVLYL